MWQYYTYKSDDVCKTDSESLKFKLRLTNNSDDRGTVHLKTKLLLKYLNNFWRKFKMPIINHSINYILKWFPTCVIYEPNRAKAFAITSAMLFFFQFVTLSTQNNT